jgi:hypothetical protein
MQIPQHHVGGFFLTVEVLMFEVFENNLDPIACFPKCAKINQDTNLNT